MTLHRCWSGLVCMLLVVIGCGRAPEPIIQPQAPPEELVKAAIQPQEEPQQPTQPLEPIQPVEPVKPVVDPPPPAKPGSGGGRILGQKVTFLGSEGFGRRFCIIADNSLSIKPPQFEQIKEEITKTLRSLDRESEFFVMFFSDKPYPMPASTWGRGGPDVDKVGAWMKDHKRVYGTIPVPAFEQAFKLQPKPDVIFFMTDGQFAAKAPEQITALNRVEPRTTINTILFTTPAGAKVAAKANAKKIRGQEQLEYIASKNGGTFRVFSAIEAK